MSYQKFDRRIMTNLGTALPRELLHANSRGAYHCSSVVGCNTRKYHGLLVVPSESGPDPTVLLSSMDETVIQHGAEFHLAVHKYHDGTLSPNGHKYIREFSVEECPRTIYRVGGVVLSKEIAFSSRINQLLIRYRLLEAHSETTLRLMPMLAFRTVKELTHVNDKIDWSYTDEDQGVSLSLYKGMPRLYLQLSKHDAVWHQEPTWYRDFFYDREAERGNACVEDLPVPGHFSLSIRRGEDIILSASDCAI
ncbi:glycogen debranching enzyme N-terminal domain-containing protein, partial [uncultured Porphyromonas sp.]|uniref:glycogen debranching enzyme N-terminal domain-containing protein n=1 Tax=uncultured Porphyromonas sp. TaxID=159274 RepID=UPI00260B456E